MRTRKYILLLGLLLTVFVCAFLAYQQYAHSLFRSSLNRINIGIWGKHTYIVSFSRNGTQHYLIPLESSQKVRIPGGLQEYKVGSLGKLASLEEDSQLFNKALGVGSGIFLHRTLYESSDAIYYEEGWAREYSLEQYQRELRPFVFLPGDMNVFDRIFYYRAVSGLKPSNTTVVDDLETKSNVALFDKTFRNERKLVQILFNNSERTAVLLARILENTGIRVTDISDEGRGGDKAKCTVVEDTKAFSRTARFISDYFKCDMLEGDTGLYEIQWHLGLGVEEKWKL